MRIGALTPLLLLIAALGLSGCGSAPRKDLNLEKLQSTLASLRSDNDVEQYARAEFAAAEQAVRALQSSTSRDEEVRAHLAYMAERRIDITRARAREGMERQRLLDLKRDRDRILLQASLQEAERARAEAERLRRQTMQRTEEAERARREAQEAEQRSAQAELDRRMAVEEAEQAKRLANAQAKEADLARQEAELASAAADSLRRQLQNLQARETNRGLMFTLGDVLFEFNEAELRPESLDNLDRLIGFISDYPTRSVSIEGHTDSRGSEAFNIELSQKRADSVRQALIERGVPASQLQSVGLGEEFPIASNETDAGRQQNRRVEIIILNEGEE
jgi:outer membrane protein OmpA-like peptidoglycan-associated protein